MPGHFAESRAYGAQQASHDTKYCPFDIKGYGLPHVRSKRTRTTQCCFHLANHCFTANGPYRVSPPGRPPATGKNVSDFSQIVELAHMDDGFCTVLEI